MGRTLRDLKDAVVVITGASSGNGRAAARAFADEGARLVLAARQREALDETVLECTQRGAQAFCVPTDVRDAEAVEALADEAIVRFGRIDVWINNAAVLHYGRLDETPAEVAEAVIATNVIGYLNGARAALRHFRERGEGTLINTGSVLGMVGHAYTAAYVASKFAIRGLTESLREEVLDQPGIHVCAVLPAAVDTPIYQRAANFTGQSVQPIRLIYPPEDVARAMVSLARRPRRRAFAGGFAPMAAAGRTLAPELAERAVRLMADAWEVGPDPAEPTGGNVLEPIHEGLRARGGWRRLYARRARRQGLMMAMGLGAAAALAIGARRRIRRAGGSP